jgi:hypothetical protein
LDIVEALLQLNRVAGDVDQPTDLQIGTVVKAPPDDDVLEISINTEMATLRRIFSTLQSRSLKRRSRC